MSLKPQECRAAPRDRDSVQGEAVRGLVLGMGFLSGRGDAPVLKLGCRHVCVVLRLHGTRHPKPVSFISTKLFREGNLFELVRTTGLMLHCYLHIDFKSYFCQRVIFPLYQRF